jgi:hypothetical protein
MPRMLRGIFRKRRHLVDHKLLTEKKARDLLSWKHSGFNLDAREKPVAADDVDGRRQNSGWRQEAADGRKEQERTRLFPLFARVQKRLLPPAYGLLSTA